MMLQQIQNYQDKIQNFLSWFESNGDDDSKNPYTIAEFYHNDYSPWSITKIFADSIPNNFEFHQEQDSFPPIKEMKINMDNSQALEFNAIDFVLRENEAPLLSANQKDKLEKLNLMPC